MDPREGGDSCDMQTCFWEKQNGSFVLKFLLQETTAISAVRLR